MNGEQRMFAICVAVIVVFLTTLLALSCGTPERMCISSPGTRASDCLLALHMIEEHEQEIE